MLFWDKKDVTKMRQLECQAFVYLELELQPNDKLKDKLGKYYPQAVDGVYLGTTTDRKTRAYKIWVSSTIKEIQWCTTKQSSLSRRRLRRYIQDPEWLRRSYTQRTYGYGWNTHNLCNYQLVTKHVDHIKHIPRSPGLMQSF